MITHILVSAALLLGPQVKTVPLPYSGQLQLGYSPAEQQWTVEFPARLVSKTFRCDFVGFPFSTTLAEAPAEISSCDRWFASGAGSVAMIDDLLHIELHVSASEAYRLDVSVAGFNGFTFVVSEDNPPPSTQPNDGGVQSCPGGSCTCQGPIGPASACCPAGFRPDCRCTQHVSSGTCTPVRPPVPPPNPLPQWGGTREASFPDFTIIASQVSRDGGRTWDDALYDVVTGDCD